MGNIFNKISHGAELVAAELPKTEKAQETAVVNNKNNQTTDKNNYENELVEYKNAVSEQSETASPKIPDKYANDNWSAVEPSKNKVLFIETGSYTYIMSNGAKIKFDNIDENTLVLENKETGEIVIIGANDTNIEGDNSDIKVTILDSDVNKIKMGKGNDNITLENSTADSIEGGKGNDVINIKNTVTNTVKGGDNEDYIYAVNSKIGSIEGGDGNDDIIAENSTVAKLDGGKGDDVIMANSSSSIEELFGGKGDDLISINNSKITKLDGGKGSDSINLENAEVFETIEDKKDTTLEKIQESVSPYDVLDTNSIEEAKNITNEKTSAYSEKELTPEEEMQALTIDFFSQNLENMKTQFEEQENEDGAIRDAYNWVKELINMGVSKEDINAAIEEQERMVSELTSALNGESDASFEEVFEKWTGLKYNQDNVTKYMETSQMYSLAVSGLYKADNFKNCVVDAKTMQDVMDLYNTYYGEEEGKNKLNEFLYQEISTATGPIYGVGMPEELYINEDNQMVIKYSDTEEYEIYDPKECINILETLEYDLHPEEEFQAQFEEITGKSIEELQDEYKINQLNAFGSGNSFQKLIDRYCADQEGFADKLATAAQIGGIGLMVIGGVVTFVNPPVGVGIMNVGKYTALGGMFGDNAIELVDDLASENGLSKDEAWGLMKESFTELALLYSGAKINGVATNVKDMVLSETQNKALAFLSQIGTDASLSLLTDLMITGEVNLTGEGISQLLGIITGIAGAKVDAYTKEAFEAADELYKNGDVDGALEYLKGKGISQRKIHSYYKAAEIENINAIFKETGNVAKALKALSESKILTESDIKNVSSELKLNVLKENNIDISKYKGYDFDSAQGKLVAQDIDMYYKALTEGINVKDLMVPSAKSIDAGLSSAKIGDVFEVEGSNHIFIKTGDCKYTELNMSKEAYCKLFPPLDRYTSGQQNSGDCYLVSSLNSIMANPNARNMLLSCFNENSDGSITVKMPNSDTEIIIKDGQTISDLGVKSGKHMTGSLGMQLLEYAYKVELVDNKIGELNTLINDWEQGILDNYNKMLGDSDIPKSQKNISFEEYRNLTETEYYKNFEAEITKILGKAPESIEDLAQFYDVREGFYVDADGRLTELGLRSFSRRTGIPVDEVEKLNEIYKVLKPTMKENKNLILSYYSNEYYLVNIEKATIELEECNNKDFSKFAEELGGNGGYSSKVFEAFGLENSKLERVENSDILDKILSNPELLDNRVATAGTILTKTDLKKIYNDPTEKNYQYYHDHPETYNKLLAEAPDKLPFDLVSSHAYSFEVRVNSATGETEIIVTNPWKLSDAGNNKDIILTVEEFKKYFDHFYIADIPQ